MSSPKSKLCCCVNGCPSINGSVLDGCRKIRFFIFPYGVYESDRRRRWIQFANRKKDDGSEWQPDKDSRICSAHFVGNARSNYSTSANFDPTITMFSSFEANRRNSPSRRHDPTAECLRPASSGSLEPAMLFNCEVCPALFSTKLGLQAHVKIRHRTKPIVCSTCGETCGSVANLFVHERTHAQQKKSFRCSRCRAVFELQSSLILHRSSHQACYPEDSESETDLPLVEGAAHSVSTASGRTARPKLTMDNVATETPVEGIETTADYDSRISSDSISESRGSHFQIVEPVVSSKTYVFAPTVGYRRSCSVDGCKSKAGSILDNGRKMSFFRFPGKTWELERRQRWIDFTNRKNPDGSAWQPLKHSKICCAHFVNYDKSNCSADPSYNPTIRVTSASAKGNKPKLFRSRKVAFSAKFLDMISTAKSLFKIPIAKPPIKIPIAKSPIKIPIVKPPIKIPTVKSPIKISMAKPPIKIPMAKPPIKIPMAKPPIKIPMEKPPIKIPMAKPPIKIPMAKPPIKIPMAKPPIKIPMAKPPIKIPMAKPPIKISTTKSLIKMSIAKSLLVSATADQIIQYQCEHCPAKFTTRFQLFRHREIHGNKHYDCVVCNKRLLDFLQLEFHELEHTGCRHFWCGKCGMVLQSQSTFITHHNSQHPESPAHMIYENSTADTGQSAEEEVGADTVLPTSGSERLLEKSSVQVKPIAEIIDGSNDSYSSGSNDDFATTVGADRSFCSVNGCRNRVGAFSDKGQRILLYKFPSKPWDSERKQRWVDFADRKNRDGSAWQPQEHSKICSAHFVDNRKSFYPVSPSYNPSLKVVAKPSRAAQRKHSRPGQLALTLKTRKSGRIADRPNRHFCGTCSTKFTSSFGLLLHRETRHGKTPYDCVVCGKTLPDFIKLAVHERTHHCQRSLRCGRCGKVFKFQTSLILHHNSHHPDSPPVTGTGSSPLPANDLHPVLPIPEWNLLVNKIKIEPPDVSIELSDDGCPISPDTVPESRGSHFLLAEPETASKMASVTNSDHVYHISPDTVHESRGSHFLLAEPETASKMASVATSDHVYHISPDTVHESRGSHFLLVEPETAAKIGSAANSDDGYQITPDTVPVSRSSHHPFAEPVAAYKMASAANSVVQGLSGKGFCSVDGCKNTANTILEGGRIVSFFRFPGRPWEIDRRQRWADFVNRKNSDGSDWQPKKNSRICSAHFVNNEKSNHPGSASFYPTINKVSTLSGWNRSRLSEMAANAPPTVQTHTCEKCSAKFATSLLLQRHLENHKNKSYDCVVCGKRIVGFFQMAVHERTHPGNRDLRCEICGKLFLLQSSFILHQNAHHPDPPPDTGPMSWPPTVDPPAETATDSVCSVSGGELLSDPHPHVRDQVTVGPPNKRMVSLGSHFRLAEPVATPEVAASSVALNYRRCCSVYGCTSKANTIFDDGQRIRFYSFPGRPWEMERRQRWIDFANRRNRDGSFWEPHKYSKMCSAHFVNNKKSNQSASPGYDPTIKVVSTPSEIVYQRRLCQRAATASQSGDPFACHECPAKFITSLMLLRHRVIIHGKQPHDCVVCGRRLVGFCQLAAHERTHPGNRHLRCGKCEKVFKVQSSFIVHQYSHGHGSHLDSSPQMEERAEGGGADSTFATSGGEPEWNLLVNKIKVEPADETIELSDDGYHFSASPDWNSGSSDEPQDEIENGQESDDAFLDSDFPLSTIKLEPIVEILEGCHDGFEVSLDSNSDYRCSNMETDEIT